MPPKQNPRQLAQSASILGGIMLGFGIGAEWGRGVQDMAIWIIVIGAFFYLYGLYVIKVQDPKIARTLWYSAWICFVILVGLILYMLLLRN